MSYARRVWAAGVELAGTWRGAIALVALALVVYAIESIGWPLAPGRDLGAYLLYYAGMWDWDAVYPWAMLSRTPVGSLVVGGMLDLGNPLLVEVVAGLMFAGSILAWAIVASTFGRAPALVVALGLVFYPGYGIVFHDWTIDAPMAALFAGWTLLLVRTCLRPTWARLALVGIGIALLSLTRPVNQVLLAAALVPLLLRASWRLRLARAAVVGGSALVLLAGWSVLNLVRYDDLTVVRGGGAGLPLFRAFVTDRIVEPENGPASRRLAAAVSSELLPREPYRGYGIDLDEFFSSGSARIHEDLIGLSDREWGWDSDYAVLARVGREAVRAHPGTFARGVAASYWEVLSQPLFAGREAVAELAPVPNQGGAPAPVEPPSPAAGEAPLPVPSEGEPIPSEYQNAQNSTPDWRIQDVWTSPIDHYVVFRDADDAIRAPAIERKLNELAGAFGDRPWSPWVGLQLDRSSKLYPPPWLLVLVGAVALVVRRPARPALLALPAVLALGVLFVTVLAVYGVPYYTVPLAPAFLLLAAGAVLGDR